MDPARATGDDDSDEDGMNVNDDQDDRVRAIVIERLELDDDALTETSLFKEDHGLDSLAIVEIQADLEREFDIVLDEDQATKVINLAGARAVVAEAGVAQSSTV